MNLEWDGHWGPATVISGLGALGVLIAVGVTWGNTTSRIEAVAVQATDAKTAARDLAEQSSRRDERINKQAASIAEIQTSIKFMAPAIARIEAKLDAVASPPRP